MSSIFDNDLSNNLQNTTNDDNSPTKASKKPNKLKVVKILLVILLPMLLIVSLLYFWYLDNNFKVNYLRPEIQTNELVKSIEYGPQFNEEVFVVNFLNQLLPQINKMVVDDENNDHMLVVFFDFIEEYVYVKTILDNEFTSYYSYKII